jgi:hypothetical protein
VSSQVLFFEILPGTNMKAIIITLFLISISGCSSSENIQSKTRSSEIQALGQGALITVNLATADKIKRGKMCKLVVRKGKTKYFLSLKEGRHSYGMKLSNGPYTIEKLSCGPFYYYNFKDLSFRVLTNSLVYLGDVDFELRDKGVLEWGRELNSEELLKSQIEAMGIPSAQVQIRPLTL